MDAFRLTYAWFVAYRDLRGVTPARAPFWALHPCLAIRLTSIGGLLRGIACVTCLICLGVASGGWLRLCARVCAFLVVRSAETVLDFSSRRVFHVHRAADRQGNVKACARMAQRVPT